MKPKEKEPDFLKKINASNGIYITFGFLLAAFAPKALQKFAETKVK